MRSMDQIYRVLVVDYENNIVWGSKSHVTEHGLITEGREVVNKAFLVAIRKLDPQDLLEVAAGPLRTPSGVQVALDELKSESAGEKECTHKVNEHPYICDSCRERVSMKLDDDPDRTGSTVE